MTSDSILKLDAVSKSFPRSTNPAVNAVSLQLNAGQILGLLGPSGCGKTTLLRLIAGFEKPSQGHISINGVQVAGDRHYVPPEKRGIGMVFQDFALFPHLTVAENIHFGLKPLRGLSQAQKDQRVQEVLALVRLYQLDHRYPHELSGGQQQRVALARALAPEPNLILLDEPLSNLDVQVRLRLREDLRIILKDSGSTAIFVTHDQEEAMAMADELAVMRLGEVEQLGTPESIYNKPKTAFVAEFVSQVNFVKATYQAQEWCTEIGAFTDTQCQIPQAITPPHGGEEMVLMIREEELQIEPDPEGDIFICDRQFLGREYRYCLRTSSGKELHARTPEEPPWSIGTKVKLDVRCPTLKVFKRMPQMHGQDI